MVDGRLPSAALVRPEFEVQPGGGPYRRRSAPACDLGADQQQPFAWRVLILVILAAVWELYAAGSTIR